MKKLFLLAALSLLFLSSRMMEVSAWPGLFWSSSAACPTPTTITPPTGTVYSTTGFSGSTAPLGAGDTVTLNAVLSPDNTVDAMKFTEGTANAEHVITVSGAEITHSFAGSVDIFIYVKEGSGSRNVAVSMLDPTFTYATVAILNPLTGAVVSSSTSFSGATATVTPLGQTSNGFWIFVVHTSTITQSGIYFQLLAASGTTLSYTGNGTSSFYAWGGAVSSP